jgi:hypothetical protein
MARQRGKKSLMDRPKQPTQWVGLKQIERWKREAAKPEYAIPAFKILNSAGKATRQAYLEMMLEMTEKFPGYGWKEQMDELEKFYADRGLSLKELPLIRSIENEPEVQALLEDPPV